MRFTRLLGALVLLSAGLQAAQLFVTDFSKNSNIFLNLNEEFPNAGTGPNSSFLYDPWNYTPSTTFNPSANLPSGVVPGYPLESDNGSQFDITTDANGNDYAVIAGGNQLNFNVNATGVTEVYLLMSAYFGGTVDISFNFSGGGNETAHTIPLPDFCGGADENIFDDPNTYFTVFRVTNQGGCATGNSTTGNTANYDLVEVGVPIVSTFLSQTLTSATITANGGPRLLLGATVEGDSFDPAPEPASVALIGLGLLAAAAAMRRRRS